MGKQKTDLRTGTLHFYADSKSDIYTYLKTYELLKKDKLELLNTRAKSFCVPTSIYLIETSQWNSDLDWNAGDYFIDGNKLSMVVSDEDTHKLEALFLCYLKSSGTEMVWEAVDGQFRTKEYCVFLEKEKVWVFKQKTEKNKQGKDVLKEGIVLKDVTKNTYTAYKHSLKKIAASTNKSIMSRRFKPAELTSIILNNGRLRDIKFHYVPKGFVKLKSQKRPS